MNVIALESFSFQGCHFRSWKWSRWIWLLPGVSFLIMEVIIGVVFLPTGVIFDHGSHLLIWLESVSLRGVIFDHGSNLTVVVFLSRGMIFDHGSDRINVVFLPGVSFSITDVTCWSDWSRIPSQRCHFDRGSDRIGVVFLPRPIIFNHGSPSLIHWCCFSQRYDF